MSSYLNVTGLNTSSRAKYGYLTLLLGNFVVKFEDIGKFHSFVGDHKCILTKTIGRL